MSDRLVISAYGEELIQPEEMYEEGGVIQQYTVSCSSCESGGRFEEADISLAYFLKLDVSSSLERSYQVALVLTLLS
jgi:hypothetical protein